MISADYAPAAYTGNASTTAFATGFKFAAAADLVVKVAGVTKTLTTDYTVAGAGDDAGGTVTFLAAPASGAAVSISRVTPRTQPVSFITQGSYAVATHEGALDRTEMQTQELAARVTANEATLSGLSGAVTGSGTANQVAYWSGTSAVAGTSNLTIAPATGNVTSLGTVTAKKLQVTDATNPHILDATGIARISLPSSGGSAGITTYAGNTAIGPAHDFDNAATIGSNATVFRVRYLGSTRFTLSRDGDGHFIGVLTVDGASTLTGKISQGFTDSSGTPGAATINKPSGKSAIAAGASSVVINNSLVSAASEVMVTALDLDGTLTSFKAVPGSGSFTVTGNAAATAAWKFSWWVLN